jgi:hypothetical protein
MHSSRTFQLAIQLTTVSVQLVKAVGCCSIHSESRLLRHANLAPICHIRGVELKHWDNE